jgi:nicotinamide mononucleotide (NMN) deamidase PncC
MEVLSGSLVSSFPSFYEAFLSIPEIYFLNNSMGSREVATTLANGSMLKFSSSCVIVIAGTIDPIKNVPSSDMGILWVAIQTNKRTYTQRLDFSPVSHSQKSLIREKACYAALKIFVQILFSECSDN